MKGKSARRITLAALTAISLALTGCGGSKVLKTPKPMETDPILATASDARVRVRLDRVIFRDGPGTWAKNATWDEYLLQVSNLSGGPIQVTDVIVVDSLDSKIERGARRSELAKGSKQTVRRYRRSGQEITAGSGRMPWGMAAATVGGATVGAVMGAGSFLGAGAGAAAVGAVVLAPTLAVGGVLRGINHSNVNRRIEQRQTSLPLEVPAAGTREIDLFFPLAPSPTAIVLSYRDGSGDHEVVIDTRAELAGLHLLAEAE